MAVTLRRSQTTQGVSTDSFSHTKGIGLTVQLYTIGLGMIQGVLGVETHYLVIGMTLSQTGKTDA